MEFKIQKTFHLQGNATPPSSKSQTIRGLMIATMACGQSVLHNALDSDDTRAAVNVCKGLGVTAHRLGGDLFVESRGAPFKIKSNKFFSDNSGITTRFVMPMLGLRENHSEEVVLDCGEQMRQRPLKSLIIALKDLGLEVSSLNNNNSCPISVKGRLQGGNTKVDGITSQYASSLLLSLPCAGKDSVIMVEDLHERPYVEMTLAWLNEQGIKYEHLVDNLPLLNPPLIKGRRKDVFKIKGGQKYNAFDKIISGDFSSASYLIAAAALIPGQIELYGLDMNDQQGDKRLVEILRSMGADIKVDGLKMIISGGKKLVGKKIDCNDIPDMVPTLAVIGTQAQGKIEIINVSQARLKETDRLKSIHDGLSRLGAKIEEQADGLVVYESKLHGAQVHGYYDHRIVMALTVAGLLAERETIIDTAESINKTFPDFVKMTRSLGANIIIV